MPETLAAAIRRKYPGTYDDMSDRDLESRIDAKYPGAYDDIPRASSISAEPRGLHVAAGSEGGTIDALPWYHRGIFAGRGPSAQDAIGALPAIGGTVGGIVGGTGGTAFGFGFGGIPGAAGGASLGGATGEALRQHSMRALGARGPSSSTEAALDIGKEAVIQPVAELTGRAAAAGLTRLGAPLAGKVDQSIAEAAIREEVEMPASALSTSKLVPLAEAWSAKGIGGSATAERYTKAAHALTAQADQVVARASSLGPSESGRVIAEGLNRFRSNWTREKGALYAAAEVRPGMKAEAAQTVALLEDIIKSKRSASRILGQGGGHMGGGLPKDEMFYEQLYKGLTTAAKDRAKTFSPTQGQARVLKPVQLRDLINARRELDAKIASSFADSFSAANKGLLKKLSATMNREVTDALERQAPDIAAKLRRANMAYAEGITKINSAYGKNIHRLAKAEKYDKIAQAVVNSRVSVDDIPKIMEVAGPEGTDAMRASVLADLVSKANGPNGLTPQGLSRAMKAFGSDRLEALLTPEQLAKMTDLAKLSGSLEKGRKVMEGSQTAFLGRYGIAPSGIGALANFPATLSYLAGDIAFNKFIGSRAGQRWLTTGFRPFSGPTMTRAMTIPAHAATVPFGVQEEP